MSEFTEEQLIMAANAPKRNPPRRKKAAKVACVVVGVSAGIALSYFLAPRVYKVITLRKVKSVMDKVGA